jgi:5'-nucleotidase
MALGNHEFDHGPETAARFAAALQAPLLAANLDTSDEPALHGRVRPWVAFRRGAIRVGVVGLITEDTPGIASPGPRLRFTSAAEAAARAIAEIRAEGPATIVLLSHLGLAADQRLAATVPGVDAILGGHSHTLLANRPDAAGPHPVVVDGPDRPVRIVQAGALGRFLGRLDLDLGPDGRVLLHGNEPLEITADLPADAEATATLARFGAALGELRRRPVAQAAPGLGNGTCRTEECALGNLLADAMLAAVPGAQVALQNGGGIRAGLPEGTVTYGDVLTVLPFGNTLATLRLRGAHLLEAIESGLSQPGAGRFPQVAGLRFTWNPAAPAGSRIVSASVAGQPLEPERVYLVVTNDFLRRGGDGYLALRDRAIEPYDTGPLLEEVVAAHLSALGTAAPRLEGRMARP